MHLSYHLVRTIRFLGFPVRKVRLPLRYSRTHRAWVDPEGSIVSFRISTLRYVSQETGRFDVIRIGLVR